MLYQCSLEGYINGRHAQLNFYNANPFENAMDEVKNRKHLPHDKYEKWIALLFLNKTQAIKDGVPETEIEDIGSDGKLFRWKAKIF